MLPGQTETEFILWTPESVQPVRTIKAEHWGKIKKEMEKQQKKETNREACSIN